MPRLPIRGLGKSWRGQCCAYCPRLAEGVDHVFARAFFPPESRANLPQAPACNACASLKAKLENELAATLPFAAIHHDATALLNLVPNKVAGNERFRKSLESQGAVFQNGTIDLRGVESLEFVGDSLIQLFELIVRGLYFHHWKSRLASEFEAKARAFPRDAARPALDLFRLESGLRVQGNVGNGAFLYQGIITADNPNAGLWRFRILGGIALIDTNGEHRVLEEFLVSTLRREFWERVAAE